MKLIIDEEPAFPVVDPTGRQAPNCGLTKREYFAALAMQGYCANTSMDECGVKEIAEVSTMQADALIAALKAQP